MLPPNWRTVELKAYVEASPRGIERPVETDADVVKANGMDETFVGTVALNVRLLNFNGVP